MISALMPDKTLIVTLRHTGVIKRRSRRRGVLLVFQLIAGRRVTGEGAHCALLQTCSDHFCSTISISFPHVDTTAASSKVLSVR